MSLEYKNIIPGIELLLALYEEAGWKFYTADKEKLWRAYQNSQDVISVWDENNLAGIIRTVGDKETILFIQDILVAKQYQKQGIGSKLLSLIIEKYPHVRQIALLTDNTKQTIKFYNSAGLSLSSKFDVVSFLKIND